MESNQHLAVCRVIVPSYRLSISSFRTSPQTGEKSVPPSYCRGGYHPPVSLYYHWVVLGDHLFRVEKTAPQTPQKRRQRERVSTLSPPGPPLSTTKGGAAAAAPPLETSPGCSDGRKLTPAAYSVTPRGFVHFSSNASCSCPQSPKVKGRAADSRPYGW